MISEEAKKIASQCRHYAMCKIDYLGTGLCPAGQAKPYVSYYPQGRMDIYQALADNLIPVTEGLIDIAQSCNLCGICDTQCHFVTGLRPLTVMKALKEYVNAYLDQHGQITRMADDPLLNRLRRIVGDEWATNDPAILVAYAHDPFPLKDMQMPKYVVLPRTRDEIVEIVRLCRKQAIPWVVRGNGGSVFGAVFTDGIVIDTNRMKGIEIDPDNWIANVEPGVTAFDLQREVSKLGLRVNVAEPAATVCGNIVCSGIFSTWSSAYGVGADHFANLEFVDREGNVFHLNQKTAPNLFAFQREVLPPPGICTKAAIRMHPTTPDEEGLLLPFAHFDEAVAFARNLSMRRIGLAIGVLGGHYLSTFISPSADLAEKTKRALQKTLGIHYAVLVIGDSHAREAIRKMTPVVIDNRMLKMLMLGLPRLLDPEWMELAEGFESDKYPYEILCREEMMPLLEAVLSPSPATIASAVEEDLREFYAQLYSREEMTSMLWLNTFRIVSPRMARHKHVVTFIVYLPLDKIEVIRQVVAEFERVGEAMGLDHAYGFLTPLDFGKRGILEYDYYIDHTDESEREKIGRVFGELDPFLEQMARRTKGVVGLKHIFGQGCARKESFLYQ